MVDIGLMQHLRGLPSTLDFAKADLLSLHEGAMAEQFVGQELMASQRTELYYWAREAPNSKAEVDYLAVIDDAIVPIEVKAGPAGRLRSLHMLLQTYPDCPRGLVFSTAPYAELPEHRLTFIPLYHVFSATRALYSKVPGGSSGSTSRYWSSARG